MHQWFLNWSTDPIFRDNEIGSFLPIQEGKLINKLQFGNTVKPTHVVTCIKRSTFSSPVIENFIWIDPLLRGHLSYKANFSLSQWWPLNTGLTVYLLCDAIINISIYVHLWKNSSKPQSQPLKLLFLTIMLKNITFFLFLYRANFHLLKRSFQRCVLHTVKNAYLVKCSIIGKQW
jgi:hypothetical protein